MQDTNLEAFQVIMDSAAVAESEAIDLLSNAYKKWEDGSAEARAAIKQAAEWHRAQAENRYPAFVGRVALLHMTIGYIFVPLNLQDWFVKR